MAGCLRRNMWLAVGVVLLATGCGSTAGRVGTGGPATSPEVPPTAAGQATARQAAGIWLDRLQMTSASTGWALRSTASPWSTKAGYLVPARTTDGARTWTDVTPPAAVALLKTSGASVVMTALTGNRAYLAVTAATTQNAEVMPTVVFGTGDGGRTWTESAPFQVRAPASLLSFAGPDDGWLLANYGGTMGEDQVWLYRTTDAGLRWSLVAAAPLAGTDRNGLPVECDKAGLTLATAQVGWLASACNAESADVLLVTRDGGARWTPQALPVPPSAFCSSGCEAYSPPQFFGPDGFVAIGNAPGAPVFLASRDLGQTWVSEPLPPGAGEYPQITFFSSRDGVLVSAGPSGAIGRIAATTADGGITWTVVPLGRSFTANGTEFDFVSPRTGFAWVQVGNATAGPPAMDETTDSGRTWTSFTPVVANG